MCGAGDETSKADKREFCGGTSYGHIIRQEVGTTSRLPVRKNREASARQLDAFRLGRRSPPLLYTAGGYIFFRTAFGVSVGTSSLSCSATLETL